MASYETKNIRNVALMGHGSEGKTTLMEALLFAAGAIDRQGRTEDGNTVTDFEAEEIKRKISISAAVAPIDWNQKMINVIDVPGYFDFIGEAMGPLRVVETAAILVSAVNGIAVGTEKAWDLATRNNVAKMFIVNQMDRDHANFMKVAGELREKFGNSVVPIILPIGAGSSYKGIVNVLENKAYERVNKGQPKEVPVPAEMADDIATALEELTEAAAGADEELMMKYLDEGELTHDEILEGFKAGMFHGEICPVVPVSALTGVGVSKLLDVMADFLPSPKRQVYTGVNPKNDAEETRKCNAEEPFSAFVYKTIADPFVGKLSLFKVMSGSINASGSVYNATNDKTEKLNGLYVLRGKKQINTQQLSAGDMGALAKLQYTNTGDTLCDAAKPIKYPAIEYPIPCISKAVFAAKQGEEDKVFSGLARLMEEDPSIRIEKNVETTETLLSGQGELHLDVIRNKLAAKFGAQANLQDPRIPYRETIKKTVKVQGRHKKQSGGHGQFGDVWIEFSPIGDTGIDFEFEDAVVGGVVPRNFIPSVEKGLRENIRKGVLAGYPMVGLHAKLYDGSYHPVDSSEMAFKTAARIAYKNGCSQASPVLLEPIMHVEVLVPDEYMGDVMGDMNKRRGRIMGMNQVDGLQQLVAEAPQAEMFKYATDLRSMTQARGSFIMSFERYEEVPANVAQKIIENAKVEDDEEE
ncbi:MAG: elongation factor G [Clostridia bacterium]|nr:elongation factor G [Clostridia bacterium]MDD6041827.1 elongation factor G [Clostridia bacterium]